MRADLVVRSWWRTRRAMRLGPAALARHRARQWAALQPALARTPALAEYAGQSLDRLPVVSTEQIRADYGRWNSLGLTDAELRAMADVPEEAHPISVGWSTGSSGGTRGLFVADEAERADYVGQSLARLLPARALLRPQRLALHLRANSALYSDVGSRRFAFAHLPLEAPIGETIEALRRFAPTILIAPPYRLLALAEAGAVMAGLRHLFYGSEPMSDAERAYVAERLGLTPQPIYQATEGFLGAACHWGRLHLNDHALEIELEPVQGTCGFRPIITDLRRHSQPIVRVRGDDFIELGEQDCPCGFAGRVLAPIAGRISDVWRFQGFAMSPSDICAAVEAELGGDHRWQANANPCGVMLRTAPCCPHERRDAAASQLAKLIRNRIPVRVSNDLPPWPSPKRRKVAWSDG